MAGKPAGSSRRQRDLAERLDQRPLQLALHAAEDLVGVLPGHWRPVWPGLDQCCEDIRDRQQSDQIGNLRVRQSIRIAGAVKIFVMMPHAVQNFRTDARYALQQIISDRGMTPDDLRQLPVEVGLQTETGFPHQGKLDYAAATLNQSTGTLPVRGVLPNSDRALLPGFFVRVRVPIDQEQNGLFVPDVALGSDQAGRYLLVVNGENIVEQRKVRVGPLEGELRVIEEGLKADDRVVTAGLLRAIPGQKVDPQLKKIEAQSAGAK